MAQFLFNPIYLDRGLIAAIGCHSGTNAGAGPVFVLVASLPRLLAQEISGKVSLGASPEGTSMSTNEDDEGSETKSTNQ